MELKISRHFVSKLGRSGSTFYGIRCMVKMAKLCCISVRELLEDASNSHNKIKAEER